MTFARHKIQLDLCSTLYVFLLKRPQRKDTVKSVLGKFLRNIRTSVCINQCLCDYTWLWSMIEGNEPLKPSAQMCSGLIRNRHGSSSVWSLHINITNAFCFSTSWYCVDMSTRVCSSSALSRDGTAQIPASAQLSLEAPKASPHQVGRFNTRQREVEPVNLPGVQRENHGFKLSDALKAIPHTHHPTRSRPKRKSVV